MQVSNINIVLKSSNPNYLASFICHFLEQDYFIDQDKLIFDWGTWRFSVEEKINELDTYTRIIEICVSSKEDFDQIPLKITFFNHTHFHQKPLEMLSDSANCKLIKDHEDRLWKFSLAQ